MAGMKNALQVISRMVADRVVAAYAVTGAVAALNYIEPTLTEDLDILISVEGLDDQPRSGLVTLAPVFAYLRNAGYADLRNEGIVIEGWPVQFLPVANDLDAEGLAEANEIEIESPNGGAPVRVRVLRAEHLVATALNVGRPKDLIRITQFLTEQAVDLSLLRAVLGRHKLRHAWSRFCAQTGVRDPYAVDS